MLVLLAAGAVAFAGLLAIALLTALDAAFNALPAELMAALAVFIALLTEVMALAFVLLALALFVLVTASPQAIPKALITRTAERAITFFISINSPVFFKG